MSGNLLDQRAVQSDLLATVSHELRSPLAAIKGYAATLLRHEQRLARAERHEFLSAIGEASDRLEAVIERLLEMSQLEGGTVRFERFPIDVERLVDDAVAAARRHVEQHQEQHEGPDYTFIVSRPGASDEMEDEMESAPLLVCGDARQLRHALDHVLENAVKYSPSGGTVSVTLRLRTTGQEPNQRMAAGHDPPDSTVAAVEMVEVEVRDHGVGIPAEHLEHVFERFHRIDTRLTRESDGLGLGLAIAQRIVALHGGDISVQSTPGEGSAFHIRLPLEAPPPTATGQAHPMETGDRADGRRGERTEGNPLTAGATLPL